MKCVVKGNASATEKLRKYAGFRARQKTARHGYFVREAGQARKFRLQKFDAPRDQKLSAVWVSQLRKVL
jgi:hypothetical protein